jgi:Helix-turn-helix family
MQHHPSAVRDGSAGDPAHRTAHNCAMHEARRAWTLFEPIHAVVYFVSEARPEFTAAGLKGGWMGYFASRSAAMGAVGPEVVAAIFHNFAPAMVRRALPDAWRFATPETVLAARLRVADAALRRLWGESTLASREVRDVASVMLQAATQLRADGRPLFAGHQGLPSPDQPHLALWHACTLLREHRFDGHTAALTARGMSGLDALITATVAKGLDPATMRSFRGWSEEEWGDGVRSLQERGLLDGDGSLSPQGTAMRDHVEEATDELAAEPWRSGNLAAVGDVLRSLALRLQGEDGLVYPNPIGVPAPE